MTSETIPQPPGYPVLGDVFDVRGRRPHPGAYESGFAGDGLFTSWTQEPNWKKAHDILLPTSEYGQSETSRRRVDLLPNQRTSRAPISTEVRF